MTSAQCEECVEREDARRARRGHQPTTRKPAVANPYAVASPYATARLADFVQRHGRAPHASRRAEDAERILGAWLSAQRTYLRRGVLHPDSIAALDRACPGWQQGNDVHTRFDALWMRTFERVAQYLADHDELPSHANGAPELAAWLIRQQERASTGDLLEHRRTLLDLLGDWQGARTHRVGLARWRATLAEVVAFRERTGSLPSTRAADPVERRLSFWLRRQRGLLRAGELLDIQVAELTATPGWEGRPSGGAGRAMTQARRKNETEKTA